MAGVAEDHGMMMWLRLSIFILLVFYFTGAARAAVTFSTLIPGNNEDLGTINSVLAAESLGPIEYLSKYDVDDGTFDGQTFTVNLDADGKSGTWSTSFDVDAIVIKGGAKEYLLVVFDTPQTSGNWCTNGCDIMGTTVDEILNGGGKNPGLSHITLFGFVAAVPEPSTWIMMLTGFAFTGFACRRRQRVETSLA